MWLTLDHHKVKLTTSHLGLEWVAKRKERLVINEITGEQYVIPDHISVT